MKLTAAELSQICEWLDARRKRATKVPLITLREKGLVDPTGQFLIGCINLHAWGRRNGHCPRCCK